MREVKKPEERRADILAMSKKLFAQKGYMNTTTQDIISALKISRGLLYYHFKSKEDILWYIAEQQTRPLFRKIDLVMKNDTYEAIEKLNKFFEATMTTDPQSEEVSEEDIQVLESIQDAMSQPENSYMTDRINHKIAYKISEQFGQILQQGNDEKVFNVSNPNEVATYLMTAFTFVMNDHNYHQNELEKSMKYFEAFVDMMTRVIQPTKPILKDLFG